MRFWETLWTVVWFGGLGVFSLLTVIITVRGAQDLRALLRAITDKPSESDRTKQ